MKQLVFRLLLVPLLLIFFLGCQKTPYSLSSSAQQQVLIYAARQYLDHLPAGPPTGNPRIDASRIPYWEVAEVVITSKGPAVLVPVFYQQDLVVTTSFSGHQVLPLNQLCRLLIYKTSSGYQTQLLTAFPDTSHQNIAGSFSGILFIEGWQGKSQARCRINGNQVFMETADTSTEKKLQTAGISEATGTIDGIAAGCGTISGYNYSPDLPGESYSWSESSGCNYTLSGSFGNPSLLPRGEYQALVRVPLGPGLRVTTVELTPPANVIGNIADYIKCFSNYAGSDHSYQVAVCVDQPVPGSRTPWTTVNQGIAGSSSAVNPIDAGHTWLVLTENFGSYSIVRNVGFYPQSNVFPWSASAQGALGDDDGHSYNVSLTVNVDNGQFFNILNFVSQGSSNGYLYNLNTNNCTTFTINALSAGGITLPSTKGNWPDGGFGNDPGDLGEDILSMPLSSNMTRSTTYSAKPNQYNCN